MELAIRKIGVQRAPIQDELLNGELDRLHREVCIQSLQRRLEFSKPGRLEALDVELEAPLHLVDSETPVGSHLHSVGQLEANRPPPIAPHHTGDPASPILEVEVEVA